MQRIQKAEIIDYARMECVWRRTLDRDTAENVLFEAPNVDSLATMLGTSMMNEGVLIFDIANRLFALQQMEMI